MNYGAFLKVCFNLANSVDPDEMQHYAAFHLGHHCLHKYPFRGFQVQRVKSFIDKINCYTERDL